MYSGLFDGMFLEFSRIPILRGLTRRRILEWNFNTNGLDFWKNFAIRARIRGDNFWGSDAFPKERVGHPLLAEGMQRQIS